MLLEHIHLRMLSSLIIKFYLLKIKGKKENRHHWLHSEI